MDMVTLTLSPKNGNHTRYFPHSGFLGLSPVIVTGYVHTRLEEDNQPLEATRLIVRIRCYEAIGSTLSKPTRPELANQQHQHHHPSSSSSSSSSSSPASSFNKLSNLNVLWQTEQTLWSANQTYESLGDWNGSWKLIVPTNAVDPIHFNRTPSNSSLPRNSSSNCPAVGSITYKTWRSWWQVETVIYHKPAGILGSKLMKSHGLYLINYREAEKYYSGRDEATTTIQSSTTSNTRIRYSITSPTAACCGDEIQIKILIGTKPQHQHQHQHLYPSPPSSSPSSSPAPAPPAPPSTNLETSSEPELILKRLQVSLIRRLAIEVLKSSPSNTPSSQQLLQINNHHKPWKLGRHLTNPNLRPINPFASSTSSIASTSPITIPNDKSNANSGSNSNSNMIGPTSNLNNKRQFTTVNTLITNTEGISKSIVLNHLDGNNPHHLSQPKHLLLDQQQQPLLSGQNSQQRPVVKYEYGFIVKLKVPLVKSKSHYSIGETCKTNLATVNFSFQFKLSIKNKLTNRLETIDLSELNVEIYSISKAEIQSALSQLKKLSTGGGGGPISTGVGLTVPAGHLSRPPTRLLPPLSIQPHHHQQTHRQSPIASSSSKSPSPDDVTHIIPPFIFPVESLSPHDQPVSP